MLAAPGSLPMYAELSFLGLTPESILQELPLHSFQIEVDHLGKEAARIFDSNPLLPGIILTERCHLIGIISRRLFLEEMSRPYGLDLFLNRPLKVLYSFVSTNVSVFSGQTSILDAAQQALKRSPEQLYEPVVVELEPQTYRLLDMYQLLLAQAQVHELTRSLLNEQIQAQMLQAEKMASLGRMIAGVAHEILNPVNFIWGNLTYLSNYTQDLIQLLSIYDEEVLELPERVQEVKDEVGLDFLLQDLPRMISSMKMGAERLKNIASGLRTFSHADSESDRKPVNLHECLDNTLLILHNRLKHDITVTKHYGDLPPVSGYSGHLNQVFMNIISNAIDALLEKLNQYKKSKDAIALEVASDQFWEPRLDITTETRTIEGLTNGDSLWVAIRIADNGPGIPEAIQKRIFESFFTTKPIGEGTGLGLAISYQIITERHEGKINVKSEVGIGTEFEILLPAN